MAKAIELSKLDARELKTFLANAERLGETTIVNAVIREMASRGLATRREYRTLRWNQERVREILGPFKDIAARVPGNQRTPYTEAGGFRIGRSKEDPEHLWIDTYCAIKSGRTNATFGCYIKQPGDEPVFRLRMNGEITQNWNADQLTDALELWRSIAHRVTVDEPARARPVEGEINYAELSREHIARYPKIRAALAK
jgi:hypothetical protein